MNMERRHDTSEPALDPRREFPLEHRDIHEGLMHGTIGDMHADLAGECIGALADPRFEAGEPADAAAPGPRQRRALVAVAVAAKTQAGVAGGAFGPVLHRDDTEPGGRE